MPGVRVWVTGASGFVGRHLVSRLEAEGCSVSASDLEIDVADSAAVAAKIAEAFQKVFASIEQVDPDEILKDA